MAQSRPRDLVVEVERYLCLHDDAFDLWRRKEFANFLEAVFGKTSSNLCEIGPLKALFAALMALCCEYQTGPLASKKNRCKPRNDHVNGLLPVNCATSFLIQNALPVKILPPPTVKRAAILLRLCGAQAGFEVCCQIAELEVVKKLPPQAVILAAGDLLIAWLNGWRPSGLTIAEKGTTVAQERDDGYTLEDLRRFAENALDMLIFENVWKSFQSMTGESEGNGDAVPPLVLGFPQGLDPAPYALSLSHSFRTAGGCRCWERSLNQKEKKQLDDQGLTATSALDLNPNPRAKLEKCSAEHCLIWWDPSTNGAQEVTLAQFIAQAVRGEWSQQFKAKAFESGMLMHLLFQDEDIGLRLGKIVYWLCSQCQHESYLLHCPGNGAGACEHAFHEDADRRFAKEGRLVVTGQARNFFEATEFYTCKNETCLKADTRSPAIQNLFKKIPKHPRGEFCPLCGIRVHGHGSRISELFELTRDPRAERQLLLGDAEMAAPLAHFEPVDPGAAILEQAETWPYWEQAILDLLVTELFDFRTGLPCQSNQSQSPRFLWLVNDRLPQDWGQLFEAVHQRCPEAKYDPALLKLTQLLPGAPGLEALREKIKHAVLNFGPT